MSRVVYKEVVEFQCVHVHCCRVVIFTRYVQYSECMVLDSIWESFREKGPSVCYKKA